MKKKSIHTLLFITAIISNIFILTACSSNTGTASALESEKKKAYTNTLDETEETASPLVSEEPTPIFSHKYEYAAELYYIITSLPEEMPVSSLKQKDIDCDTLQWFNATYSVFTYHSGCDYHLVGGYSDESDTIDSSLLSGLEQSWGITDRATAIESIAWLAYGGHALEYENSLQLMYDVGMLTDDANDVSRVVYSLSEDAGWSEEERQIINDYYSMIKMLYENCGEKGIDAWDYCRIMQISGNCYYAGYLTLEECMTIQLATAKVIQDEFDSWDEMNTSYLQGYYYWSYDSTISYAHRLWAYQDLMQEADCPFTTLDFDMKLEKFW